MATKLEMMVEIELLALELNLDVETNDEMSAKVLGNLLSDLRAKKRDADNVTAADDAKSTETASNETEDQEVVISDGFVIAPGKSVTSKKGIIGEGESVKAEYFAEGAFESLIKREVIIKG